MQINSVAAEIAMPLEKPRYESEKPSSPELKKPVEIKKQEEKPQFSEKDVFEAIEKANQSFNAKYTRFEFSIHEATKQIMVKIFDRDSDELIREIPPETMLDMVAKIWELAGILVDEKV